MKYDVVIIGGGLSGMMAAALLARKRKKVLVLEQHTTVGGLAAGFTRKGYYFDSAMHCLMAGSTHGFYENLGISGQLDFRPHRTLINIEGQRLNAANAAELTQELGRVFPDQKDGIERFYQEQVAKYADLITAMTRIGTPMFYSGFKSVVKFMEFFGAVSRVGFKTLSKISGSDGRHANNILKAYLPEESKAYVYLCNKSNDITYKGNFEMSNFAGNWVWPFQNRYPYHGFQKMSDEFAKVVTDCGGEIIYGAKVTQILLKNYRAVGVVYRQKEAEIRVDAAKVISAIDLKQTFCKLIGAEKLTPEFAATVWKQEMSSAVPILYLGVNLDRDRVGKYFNGLEEVFYIPEIKIPDERLDNRDYYQNTSLRMASSCLINPQHAPDGKTNLQIYLPCPPVGWLDNWGIVNGQRTGEYKKIKEMVTEQALEVAARIIPELRNRSLIEECELGTPFTIERYTGNSEGSHGGFTWEREKCHLTGTKLGSFYNSHPDFKDLYFIGHQTGYMGGVTNALWSAQKIVSKI